MSAFFISDTHFGHVGVTQFLRDDGTKLRPWDNVDEMNESMVTNWNNVVGKKDTVYHLGDVVMNRRALPILGRLNGRKVLIKGNHDIFKLQDYAPYFEDIRAYDVKGSYIASHIPVHPESLGRFLVNVHGHTHARRVLTPDGGVDLRYKCVCVEQINYTPVPVESVLK
jgi:calcineurin-like phosphoesterase family protein